MNRSERHLTTGEQWTGHEPQTPGFRRLLAGLFFAGVATFAQLYSPQGLLPLIVHDLQVTPDRAALLISASTIGLALAVIPWSFVGDRLGRKPAMTISIVAACAFGIAATLTPAFSGILLFRVLEGAALGGVPALAMAYLHEEVHPMAAGQTAGTFIAGTVVGGLFGRIVAAPVGEWLHWRAGMGLVLGIAILCAIFFLLLTPPAKKFKPTTTSLRTAVRSITANLRSPVLLVMYAQGLLLMGGFIAIYNFLGFELIDSFGLPLSIASLIFLAYLMGTVTSSWAGRLATKHGPSRVLLAFIGAMIVGTVLLLAPNLWVVLLGTVLFSGAFFGAHSVASGWAGAAAAVGGRAQSSALYNLSYYAGSSVFGWLGGIFFTRFGWSGTVAMTTALALIGCLITALLYIFVVQPRIKALQ